MSCRWSKPTVSNPRTKSRWQLKLPASQMPNSNGLSTTAQSVPRRANPPRISSPSELPAMCHFYLLNVRIPYQDWPKEFNHPLFRPCRGYLQLCGPKLGRHLQNIRVHQGWRWVLKWKIPYKIDFWIFRVAKLQDTTFTFCRASHDKGPKKGQTRSNFSDPSAKFGAQWNGTRHTRHWSGQNSPQVLIHLITQIIPFFQFFVVFGWTFNCRSWARQNSTRRSTSHRKCANLCAQTESLCCYIQQSKSRTIHLCGQVQRRWRHCQEHGSCGGTFTR